jgi:NTE family protein
MSERKHALVISGGGAKGAWAVGVLRHLCKDRNQRFDLVVGTSTGALIAPLAALGDIDDLVRVYTTVRDKDILSFRFLGKNVVMNALVSLVLGKDSLYGTGPLQKTIEQHLSQERWNRLVSGPVPAWVSVVSLQTGEIKYVGSHQPGMTRERFAAAMLASGSIPVYMQRVKIPGEAWQWFVDGGVKDVIPLGQAIREGARDITAILLGIEPPPAQDEFKRIHKMVLRTISLQMEETAANDVSYGNLITRELLWRARLRDILARRGDAGAVDAAFEEASTKDEPMASKGRRFAAVRLRLLRPKEEIGETLDFHPERLKAYEQAGYDFAANDANWTCVPAAPLYDESLRTVT